MKYKTSKKYYIKNNKILLEFYYFYGYNINMKKVILILSEIIILIIYVYLLSIDNIPSNIILFEGENLNIKTLFGVTCETVNTELINTEQEDTAVQVSSNLNKTTVGQKSTLLFKLFDKITLKRSRCRRNKKCKSSASGKCNRIKALYKRSISSRNE